MAVDLSWWITAQSILLATPHAYFIKKCVRVLAFSMRKPRIRMNGDWRIKETTSLPRFTGKMAATNSVYGYSAK